jgi:hypothetical protein
MALDYKTLQALAAAEPQEAAGHCPECGRAWGTSGPEAPHPLAPFPWRAVLLGVVGLALALTFGLRAARVPDGIPRR